MADFERMVERYLEDNLAIKDVKGNVVQRLWGEMLVPDEKVNHIIVTFWSCAQDWGSSWIAHHTPATVALAGPTDEQSSF